MTDERDAAVPVITKTSVKDGWRSEMIRVRGRSVDVFISPEGLRYVRALETEPADLIVAVSSTKYVGSWRTRLRLEQGSAIARAGRREKRLVQRGEAVRNKQFQEAFSDPAALPSDALARQKPKRVRRKR